MQLASSIPPDDASLIPYIQTFPDCKHTPTGYVMDQRNTRKLTPWHRSGCRPPSRYAGRMCAQLSTHRCNARLTRKWIESSTCACRICSRYAHRVAVHPAYETQRPSPRPHSEVRAVVRGTRTALMRQLQLLGAHLTTTAQPHFIRLQDGRRALARASPTPRARMHQPPRFDGLPQTCRELV